MQCPLRCSSTFSGFRSLRGGRGNQRAQRPRQGRSGWGAAGMPWCPRDARKSGGPSHATDGRPVLKGPPSRLGQILGRPARPALHQPTQRRAPRCCRAGALGPALPSLPCPGPPGPTMRGKCNPYTHTHTHTPILSFPLPQNKLRFSPVDKPLQVQVLQGQQYLAGVRPHLLLGQLVVWRPAGRARGGGQPRGMTRMGPSGPSGSKGGKGA